jgi:hypothetical protein
MWPLLIPLPADDSSVLPTAQPSCHSRKTLQLPIPLSCGTCYTPGLEPFFLLYLPCEFPFFFTSQPGPHGSPEAFLSFSKHTMAMFFHSHCSFSVSSVERLTHYTVTVVMPTSVLPFQEPSHSSLYTSMSSPSSPQFLDTEQVLSINELEGWKNWMYQKIGARCCGMWL